MNLRSHGHVALQALKTATLSNEDCSNAKKFHLSCNISNAPREILLINEINYVVDRLS